MDITEIRRRNLTVLEAEFHTLKAIGELMAKSAPVERASANYANVLSQYKGAKKMGDKFARNLEASVGKARGWMDTPQFKAVEDTMEAIEAGQLAMNMAAEDRDAWLRHGRLLAQQNPKRSIANPFGDLPPGGVDALPHKSKQVRKPTSRRKK